ncbi:hypothetical protein CIJ80_00375 [Neisseria meningitidis]|nr:hypothetical protein CIJ80_00375 [Neisseria meningitidis]
MNLSNHFLVAMPDMEDAFFSQSVVYICKHDEDGALGIAINKPSDYDGHDFFRHRQKHPHADAARQRDDGRAGASRARLCRAYPDRQLAKQYRRFRQYRANFFPRRD